MVAGGGSQELPWRVIDYPLDGYPFPRLVAETLEVDDLTRLSADLPRRTWQTDQQSPWHAAFYAGFESWRNVYRRLVRNVIRPHVGEPFYYQAVPTFRVHLPGNVAVGELHTDAQYHHPVNEVNYWLPLTHAYNSSSVWIEDDDGVMRAPEAWPGDLVEFSAATRRHGNQVNLTGRTRVSFDFRVIPVRMLPLPHEEGLPTEHTKLRFIPGEYYATEIITGDYLAAEAS